MSAATQVHATCVAIGDDGVLLRGPSGSGKSDLALRLIRAGAALVADDRVDLRREAATVIATAPPSLAGLIEVRGVGVVDAATAGASTRASTPVSLVVELVPPRQVVRLPDAECADVLGLPMPLLRLAPFEASAPDRLFVALRRAAGDKALRTR